MIGKPRPAGLNLIGTLAVMGGVLGLTFGMVITLLAAIFSLIGLDLFGFSGSVLTLGVFIGIGVMVLGAFWTGVGFGVLKGRRSAWNTAITTTILSILFAAAVTALGFYLAAIALVPALILLFYFTRGNVRTFFLTGAGPYVASPMLAPRTSPNIESLLETVETARTRKCQNCGGMVAAEVTMCPYCGAPA